MIPNQMEKLFLARSLVVSMKSLKSRQDHLSKSFYIVTSYAVHYLIPDD